MAALAMAADPMAAAPDAAAAIITAKGAFRFGERGLLPSL
jgi:hypothetical protein